MPMEKMKMGRVKKGEITGKDNYQIIDTEKRLGVEDKDKNGTPE